MSREPRIEHEATLTEASVAFLLEHRRDNPDCSMASLTIRERLVRIEDEAAALAVARDPDPAECGICGDYTVGGREVHEYCLDDLTATHTVKPSAVAQGSLDVRAGLA